MSATFFQAHLLKDMGNGIAYRRSRRKGEIDDAEGHVEPFGGFVSNQLAHARDLKRRALDEVRNAGQVTVRRLGECRAHHAGAGNAHIDHAVRLTRAMKCARHEGVVIRRVAKDNELCAADAVAVRCDLCRLAHDFTHHPYGIHIDAGLGGTDIDGGADVLCAGERLRNAADERFVPRGKALLHQRRIAADEVDAHSLCRTLKRQRVFNRVSPARCADHGDRGNGNTLIDDRDTEFPLDLLSCAHKTLCPARDLIVNAAAGLMEI